MEEQSTSKEQSTTKDQNEKVGRITCNKQKRVNNQIRSMDVDHSYTSAPNEIRMETEPTDQVFLINF